jgi:tRNA G26 N,N-dimethylase Trm1
MDSNDVVTVNMKLIDRTFPTVKGVDKRKLLMTNVGVYSVSKTMASDALVKLIKSYFTSEEIVVTDATGNVGSDSIMLALNFKHVNSIEMSPDQYKVLTHNVNVYGLQDKMSLHNGDSMIVLNELDQDVIYIDAPWGGVNYKEETSMSLFMSGKELSEIYQEYKHLCKIMIFKVPKNYNFTRFMQNSTSNRISIFSVNKHDKLSFYFIICN